MHLVNVLYVDSLKHKHCAHCGRPLAFRQNHFCSEMCRAVFKEVFPTQTPTLSPLGLRGDEEQGEGWLHGLGGVIHQTQVDEFSSWLMKHGLGAVEIDCLVGRVSPSDSSNGRETHEGSIAGPSPAYDEFPSDFDDDLFDNPESQFETMDTGEEFPVQEASVEAANDGGEVGSDSGNALAPKDVDTGVGMDTSVTVASIEEDNNAMAAEAARRIHAELSIMNSRAFQDRRTNSMVQPLPSTVHNVESTEGVLSGRIGTISWRRLPRLEQHVGVRVTGIELHSPDSCGGAHRMQVFAFLEPLATEPKVSGDLQLTTRVSNGTTLALVSTRIPHYSEFPPSRVVLLEVSSSSVPTEIEVYPELA